MAVYGTALIVDDEDEMRGLIAEMLATCGFRVLSARDGAEAVELMRERGREVDLAICDLVMPEVGGVELCKRLRLIKPGLPILLLSGYEFETHNDFGAAPPQFLQKPFTMLALVEKIESLMGKTPA